MIVNCISIKFLKKSIIVSPIPMELAWEIIHSLLCFSSHARFIIVRLIFLEINISIIEYDSVNFHFFFKFHSNTKL